MMAAPLRSVIVVLARALSLPLVPAPAAIPVLAGAAAAFRDDDGLPLLRRPRDHARRGRDEQAGEKEPLHELRHDVCRCRCSANPGETIPRRCTPAAERFGAAGAKMRLRREAGTRSERERRRSARTTGRATSRAGPSPPPPVEGDLALAGGEGVHVLPQPRMLRRHLVGQTLGRRRLAPGENLRAQGVAL